MKKGLYVLQVLILSLLFIGCNSEDEQTPTPIVQGAKTELFAVGTTRITRAAAKPYLFTLENINSFNVQTREIVFQDLSLQVNSFRFTVIQKYIRMARCCFTSQPLYLRSIVKYLQIYHWSRNQVSFILATATHETSRTTVTMPKITRLLRNQEKNEQQNGEGFSQYSENMES